MFNLIILISLIGNVMLSILKENWYAALGWSCALGFFANILYKTL